MATEADALWTLFEGLPQQGPGSDASTRRALEALTGLPVRPRAADLGCGSGRASLVLARETGGDVVALDIHRPFLAQLRREAQSARLRLTPILASMAGLPFRAEAFDLIWSEGAIYFLGFEQGLREWRPLLRRRGFVCVTELSWLTDRRPAAAKAFFEREYPAMGDIATNRAAARRAGFDPFAHFALPSDDWRRSYYGPLVRRIEALRPSAENDPALAGVIAATEEEIALYDRFGDSFGYVFYLMQLQSPS